MRFLLFILVLLMVSCSESEETRKQRLLAQGNDMVEKQHVEEAVKFYEGALKLDSCFADALNNLGTLYHQQRDFEKANEYYKEAIACNPAFVSAYLNRANTLYELNALPEALADLEKVSKLKPDTVTLYFSRGIVYTKLRAYGKAKAAFRQAITLDPTNVELKINLGTVYYYEQKYDSAKNYLLPIVRRLAQPEALNTLAMIEIDKGQYDSAQVLIEQASKLKADDPYILNNRGLVRILTGDLASGVADINQSITLDPYNGWAYRNKGVYYLKMKNATDALRLLLQAEKIDPSIKDLNFYLARAYALDGNDKLAREYDQKALETGGVVSR